MQPPGERALQRREQPPPAAGAPNDKRHSRERQHEHRRSPCRRRDPPRVVEEQRPVQGFQPALEGGRVGAADTATRRRVDDGGAGMPPSNQ